MKRLRKEDYHNRNNTDSLEHCGNNRLTNSRSRPLIDIKLGTAMAIDVDASASAASAGANDGEIGVEVELDSTSITYDSDDDLSYDTIMSEDQGSGCGSDDCNDSNFHTSGNGGGNGNGNGNGNGSNYNATLHKDLLWIAARQLHSKTSEDVDRDADADVNNRQRLPPAAVKVSTKDANGGCGGLRNDDPILLDLDLSLLENNGKDRSKNSNSNIASEKSDKCASRAGAGTGTGTVTSSTDLLQLLMDDDDDSALLSEDEDDVHIDLGGDVPTGNRTPSSSSSSSSSPPTSKTKDISKTSSYTEQYLAKYSANATATAMSIPPPPSSLPHSHSREVDLMTLDEEELEVHLNFCDFDQPLFTIMEGEQLLYMNEWINEALFILATEEDGSDDDYDGDCEDEETEENKVKVREKEVEEKEKERIKAQKQEQEQIEEVMAKDEDEHGTFINEANDIDSESLENMITENHYDYDIGKNNELELAKQIDEEDDLSEEEEFDFEYIPNYYSAPSISASASPDSESDSDIDYAGIDYIGANSFSFPYSLSGSTSDSADFDNTNSALTIAATTSAVLSSFTCGTSWSTIQDEEDEGDYDDDIREEMKARLQIESLLSSSQSFSNSVDENENELHTSTPMQLMDDTLFTIKEEPGAEMEADEEEEEPKKEMEPQAQKAAHMEVFQTASTASMVSPKSSTALENALFLRQDSQPKSKSSCSAALDKDLFLQQGSHLKSRLLSSTPSIRAEPKRHAEECKDLGLGLDLDIEPGKEIKEEEQGLCDDYESECEWITTYSNASTYTDQDPDQDTNTETKSEDPMGSTVEVITNDPRALTGIRTSEVKRRTSLLQQIRTRSRSKKNSDGSSSAKSRYSKQHISSSSLPHLEAEDLSNPNPADESIQDHEPTTSFGISTLPLYYLKQSFNLR